MVIPALSWLPRAARGAACSRNVAVSAASAAYKFLWCRMGVCLSLLAFWPPLHEKHTQPSWPCGSVGALRSCSAALTVVVVRARSACAVCFSLR